MADATAKFPTAAAALSDFYGEFPNFPEAVLSGAHNNSVATITLTATVNTAWATIGAVTIDSEIITYTGKAGATLTGCTRGAFGTSAASHADAAKVGVYLTARTVNQILAEVIAVETQLLGGQSNPNLILNSDFSRRTVFGLAMPEAFADLSGTTKIDGGAAGAVASNIFTQGAANNEYAWCAGAFVWRDGRASATFKATATAGIYELRWRISATDYISVKQNNGNFTITKFIASALTVTSTVANALTLNRWYWLELDKQGTTVNARFYDTGGTVPGVTKASSTETTAARLTATIADASVAVGASVSITSDQAAAQWGGIATGNGGVYVETWLQESWAVTFGGTLGGQAVGYDESADSGPLNKQLALRTFFPNQARATRIQQITPAGTLVDAQSYSPSIYSKLVSLGSGTANVASVQFAVKILGGSDPGSGTGTSQTNYNVANTDSASWVRKTTTTPLNWTLTAREFQITISDSASGPAFTNAVVAFMLPQLEQGSAATAWRGAPADDAPMVWELKKLTDTTTTSAAAVNADDRDLAGNFSLPWDANVVIESSGSWYSSGANTIDIGATVDATYIDNAFSLRDTMTGASVVVPFAFGRRSSLAAGKHRIALGWRTSAGTASLYGSGAPSILRVTATRGK